MAYHIDDTTVNLDDLRKRIEETDLVPSRASLLDGIKARFKAFEQLGITTLASLRNGIKNPKRRESVSSATGIDIQYLVLLRREIESYFPKPFVLKVFDWLPKDEIAKLEKKGIRNTAALFEAASQSKSRKALAKSTGVDLAVLEAFVRLADLTRVQWVSPTAARMLMEAGYISASRLATADAEDLCEALARINEGNRFFKGKIGLRDIRRLIRAAGYIPS